MPILSRRVGLVALALALAHTSTAQEPAPAPRLLVPAPFNTASLKALELRGIGPCITPGRIGDIAIDPKNRSVWYVAMSSGGVWKTTNRGITWKPIFDNYGSYSIGCVTVDPKNSDVVWLGTGENQSQRSVGFGDGIYKSTNGGTTWTNVGLKNSEHIAKILVDPRDSNVVYRRVAGTALVRRAATAASSRRPMAARPGRPCSRSARTPASPTSASTRAIRT